jgi:hypothetical protein
VIFVADGAAAGAGFFARGFFGSASVVLASPGSAVGCFAFFGFSGGASRFRPFSSA